jgi:hypothetical protein
MTLDLAGYDRPEHRHCLTARDVTRHADLYALAYLCTDNRALVAHLPQTADELMLTAQTLSRLFLVDGHNPLADRQPGLTETQRLGVLTLASTCAYNAALFVQEAQRRRVTAPDRAGTRSPAPSPDRPHTAPTRRNAQASNNPASFASVPGESTAYRRPTP